MANWFYAKAGQQLGPVDEAALVQLARDGQLRPEDLVWKVGMAQWVRASQVQGLFAAPAAGAPPAIAPVFVAPTASPMQDAAMPYRQIQPDDRTSGMAIASLVCGLAFCIPLCPLLAIIFGIIGIRQTGEGRMRGRGLAIAGLVLGLVLGLAGISVELAMLPGFRRGLVMRSGPRETANRVKCAANERSIGQAILMYCNDNHGQYPPDLVTLVKNEDITTGVFVCPASNDTPATSPDSLLSGGHCSYIYLGQALTTSADPATVVLYEDPADHGDGVNMLFADGHVEFEPYTDPIYTKTVKTSSPGK